MAREHLGKASWKIALGGGAVIAAGSLAAALALPVDALAEGLGEPPSDVVPMAYSGFRDASSGDWFVDEGYLDYVLDNGILSGYGTTFGTADAVIRGDVATVLWRMAGEPPAGDPGFADVPAGAYYATAVAWARDEGIVTGVDESTFAPGTAVTREQLVTMLYRYAQNVAGLDVSADPAGLDAIAGADEVSSFARDAMAWAVDRGIITGKVVDSVSRVEPQSGATRAELAKIVTIFRRDVLGEKGVSQPGNALFAQLPATFVWTSGAGGWETELRIDETGSFTGRYFDGELGDRGPANPNGTMYLCTFTGKLSEPVARGDGSYSCEVIRLTPDRDAKRVYYENGMKYILTEPNGLALGNRIVIYSPGMARSEFPEAFVTWMMYAHSAFDASGSLVNYGIYNQNLECGFFGYDER